MGFSDPAGAETVTVTGNVVTQPGSVTGINNTPTVTTGPGSTTTTGAGSTVENSPAAAAALNAAVIQGLLPVNVPFAAATSRGSGSTVINLNGAGVGDILGANVNVQYILKLAVLSCNVVGTQQWQIAELTPAGVVVKYVIAALCDVSKTPLLVPYQAGLVAARGNRITVFAPAAAGLYQVTIVFDVMYY